MKLSIIIPAYNAEKYIDKAVHSVVKQSFHDYELIIVNDGSTDGTRQICERWQAQEDTIKLINQENSGSSIARKKGVFSAQGEYCTFLDADDWFCATDTFQRLVDRMQDHQLDVLQFSYKKVYKFISKAIVYPEHTESSDEFWQTDCSGLLGGKIAHIAPNAATKVYRTALLKKALELRGVERLFVADDLCLNLIFFSQPEVQRIESVPWVCYAYRQFSGGVFKADESILDDYEIAKRAEFTAMQEHNCPEAFVKQCHVESAYIVRAACMKASVQSTITLELVKKCYSYQFVKNAVAYLKAHPEGSWPYLDLFVSEDYDQYWAEMKRLAKQWRPRIKRFVRKFI